MEDSERGRVEMSSFSGQPSLRKRRKSTPNSRLQIWVDSEEEFHKVCFVKANRQEEEGKGGGTATGLPLSQHINRRINCLKWRKIKSKIKLQYLY